MAAQRQVQPRSAAGRRRQPRGSHDGPRPYSSAEAAARLGYGPRSERAPRGASVHPRREPPARREPLAQSDRHTYARTPRSGHRIAVTSVAVFVALLVFLAARVWAGDDPALSKAAVHAKRPRANAAAKAPRKHRSLKSSGAGSSPPAQPAKQQPTQTQPTNAQPTQQQPAPAPVVPAPAPVTRSS